MKLWLLRPAKDLPAGNPWDPWYDKSFGFVVRADTETAARVMARDEAGDEGGASWMDLAKSTCTELLPAGEPGVVIQDYARA